MRNNKFLNGIIVFVDLIKLKVTLLVTLTTLTGYLLFSSVFTLQCLYAILGIFILASGSAALNQIQEKDFDKVMPRTKNRPIPSNKINVNSAILISVFLILFGSVVLYLGAGLIPFLLGIFTLVWYNGIYTYLKRITAFAVVPGSIVGAIPPLVGWTAAGGVVYDFNILALAFYLFVWQIPHFWLLLIIYGDDYEIAGLPTLSKIFNLSQIKRLTFVWIIAAISSAILLAFFINLSVFLFYIIVLASLILVGLAFLNLLRTNEIKAKQNFIFINLYTLIILALLIINAIKF